MLDLLLPQRCVVCGLRGPQLCDACLARLPRIEHPLCERCGTPTVWPVRRCRECAGRRLAFASARGAVHYDEAVRAFVAAWKERSLRRLAAAAVSVVLEVVPPPVADVLTFLPPDPDRGLKRFLAPAITRRDSLPSSWPSTGTCRSPGRSGVAERRNGSAGSLAPSGAAMSPASSLPKARFRTRSCSSTTSTRAARLPMPPPRRFVEQGHGESRS